MFMLIHPQSYELWTNSSAMCSSVFYFSSMAP